MLTLFRSCNKENELSALRNNYKLLNKLFSSTALLEETCYFYTPMLQFSKFIILHSVLFAMLFHKTNKSNLFPNSSEQMQSYIPKAANFSRTKPKALSN